MMKQKSASSPCRTTSDSAGNRRFSNQKKRRDMEVSDHAEKKGVLRSMATVSTTLAV